VTFVGIESRSRLSLNDLLARARAWLGDGSDHSIARRAAGAAFLIRVASAAIAFGSQVLLARFMGGFEFGIFVYVWTCLLLVGGFVDLGLASSAQRFIPEYSEHGALAKLRGFLSGSRWLAFAIATALAILGALAVSLLRPLLDDYTIVPLYLACIALPVHGVMHTQDGIARSYNWIALALVPPYILRQFVMVGLMAAAFFAGLPTDAVTAVALAGFSLWLVAFGQTFALNRKLKKEIPAGPKDYEIRRWLAVSLPMFLVESLYLLLLYIDVVVLKAFRAPEEIAVYYAANKTLAFVAFVYFAVAAAAAHRFTEYHVAGDHARLADFAADAVRWTFWPSLAATVLVLACGWPLLWLFGTQFVAGYGLMFVLAIGLLARAAIGPGERLLNMLGQQRACALAAATAVAINLALCLVLIPRYGIMGAATATSAAFCVESLMIFLVARRRLGIHLFVFGRPAAGV
jgi:O-antigen/teichoic acid export membrane protein